MPLSPGRPPLPPELREFARLTRAEIVAILSKIWKMPADELARLAAAGEMPAGELATINVFLKTIENGDVDAWEKVLNRMIGKVVDKSKSKTVNEHKFSTLTDDELIRRAQDALQLLLSDPEGGSN